MNIIERRGGGEVEVSVRSRKVLVDDQSGRRASQLVEQTAEEMHSECNEREHSRAGVKGKVTEAAGEIIMLRGRMQDATVFGVGR